MYNNLSDPVHFPASFPPETQFNRPGFEFLMNPQPTSEYEIASGEIDNSSKGKLHGKIACITGGDSGIGRAVAIAFAKEGADVCISYLNEHEDANVTKQRIEQIGRKAICIPGDIGDSQHCMNIIATCIETFRELHILVNNAAEQHPQPDILHISDEQLERTFKTNILSYFYMTRCALPFLKSGSVIINTTSITAYEGNEQLLDYSASKGAIAAFTRSLAKSLVKQEIRVNAVAPGPIWTPLIPSTFSSVEVAHFGSNTPMKRAGQPCEIAPAYVYLASRDSSYMTGQVLHLNGGTIVNG